jgi:hypothetical protein
MLALVGAAAWLYIKWHTNGVRELWVGFGLFWLGVIVILGFLTKDYSE